MVSRLVDSSMLLRLQPTNLQVVDVPFNCNMSCLLLDNLFIIFFFFQLTKSLTDSSSRSGEILSRENSYSDKIGSVSLTPTTPSGSINVNSSCISDKDEKNYVDSPTPSTTPQQPKLAILPEFRHIPRPPRVLDCHPTTLPSFLCKMVPKVELSMIYFCNCLLFFLRIII